jgi:hypothetical protein
MKVFLHLFLLVDERIQIRTNKLRAPDAERGSRRPKNIYGTYESGTQIAGNTVKDTSTE